MASEANAVTGDEQAKAVQETAKFGQKAIEATADASGFIVRIFGPAIEQYAGALADTAAAFRLVNRARIVEKTRAQLDKLGVKNIDTIQPRYFGPLFQAISDESDEEIQDVWATYIANALNPENLSVKANRQLIEIIRQFEPHDLRVLSAISYEELRQPRSDHLIKSIDNFASDDSMINESLARLTALGLFSFENSPENKMTWLSGDAPGDICCRLAIKTPYGKYYTLPLLMILKNAIR